MEDQINAFLSNLNKMKDEEVRTHFLDLFAQALAIENEENEQKLVMQEQEEEIKEYCVR